MRCPVLKVVRFFFERSRLSMTALKWPKSWPMRYFCTSTATWLIDMSCFNSESAATSFRQPILAEACPVQGVSVPELATHSCAGEKAFSQLTGDVELNTVLLESICTLHRSFGMQAHV